MATAVEAAIVEIKASLAELEPQQEGLTDFASLDLLPPARNEINEAITRFNRRVALLHAALDACEELMADGHPNMAVEEIPDAAYADLVQNAATIQAALAKFSSGAATAISLNAGAAEPKP